MYKKYPMATRSRWDHLGVCGDVAEEVLDALDRNGRLDVNRTDMKIATQLHDAAHYALSHDTEKIVAALTGKNHKQAVLDLLNSPIVDRRYEYDKRFMKPLTLAEVISQVCNGDLTRIRQLLDESDPHMQICSHPILGVDKLVYPEVDAVQTGFDSLPPHHSFIYPHLTYKKDPEGRDRLGIEVSLAGADPQYPIWWVNGRQEFYQKMYIFRYWERVSLILQRHVEKAFQRGIESGIISDPSIARDIRDEALIHLLENGHGINDPRAEQSRRLIDGFNHQPYESVVAFKRPGCKRVYPDERLFTMDDAVADKFCSSYKDPRKRTELEDAVEQDIGCPVLIPLPPALEKLEPKDVAIFSRGEFDSTVNTEEPENLEKLRRRGRKFFSVHVPSERHHELYRESNVRRLAESVKEQIKKYCV